jgi:hypothetical protein
MGQTILSTLSSLFFGLRTTLQVFPGTGIVSRIVCEHNIIGVFNLFVHNFIFKIIHSKPPLIAFPNLPSLSTNLTMSSHHLHPSPKNAFAFAPQTHNHQRTSTPGPSASSSKKFQLPAEFQPSDYSVVCGRGKDSFNHVGNHRFRALVTMFIERYSQAGSKVARSAIVSEIIDVIRQAGGNFCKLQRGAWFVVGDPQAREKVGALLRDLLYTQYRSSAKAKVRRRWSLQQKENQDRDQRSGQTPVDDTDDSDDCSTTSACWGSTKESLGFEYWLEEPDDFFEIDVF